MSNSGVRCIFYCNNMLATGAESDSQAISILLYDRLLSGLFTAVGCDSPQ